MIFSGRQLFLFGRTVLGATIGLGVHPLWAQELPPSNPLAPAPGATSACQPPSSGEYLLLVVSPTPENQDQVRRILPPNATGVVCNYLTDVVTRVSGFTAIDTANAWAKYITETTGLSAFVARPAEVPPVAQVPTTTPSANPPSVRPTAPVVTQPAQPASRSRDPLAFSPQELGNGYAVLVDYFNQPELAVQVRQVLNRDIGLASYGQRPYLMALYTNDATIANSVLQTLTNQGYWAIVVDSRRVTLLRQAIDTSRLTSRSATPR